MSLAPGYTILAVTDCYLDLHLSYLAKLPSSDRDFYMQINARLDFARRCHSSSLLVNICSAIGCLLWGSWDILLFTSVSVMGNSFVFVDVSMEIVHGKFTSGNGGHTRISVLPR